MNNELERTLTQPLYSLPCLLKFALLNSLERNNRPNYEQPNEHKKTKPQPNKKTANSAEDISDHVYLVHPSTDISVDISTDSRPTYWSTYQPSDD